MAEEYQIEEAEPEVPPAEPTENPDSEKDLIDALESAIQNQENIGNLPPETLKEILKEKKAQLLEFKDLREKSKLDTEFSEEVKKQISALKGSRYGVEKINSWDSNTEIARKTEHNQDVENYKKSRQDFIDAEARRLKGSGVVTIPVPLGKTLQDLTLKERTKLFADAGLIAKPRQKF